MSITASVPRAKSSPGGDERSARISRTTRVLQRPEFGALMGAVAVFLIFTFLDATPNHIWLTQTGIAAWTQQSAFFGIMAVPVGLLMIGGEFDLSTGVMTGVSAIVMALLIGKLHWNAWAAIGGTLLFATVVGLVNGLVVVKTKLPSFIVTLATFFVLRGASIGFVLHVNQGSTNVDLTAPKYAGLGSARAVFGSSFAPQQFICRRLAIRRRCSGLSASQPWARGSSPVRPSATGYSPQAVTLLPPATPAFP